MRYLGKTVLNGLLLGAAAGALTVGFASKSYAGAVGFSSLQISNFQFLQEDGSPFTGGSFDALQINNFTAAEARLNGSGPTADDFSPGASDVAMQCVGDCGGIAQNDFNQQGGAISQFSRADAQLFGNSLDAGITANSVAEVQLNVPSDGSSSSNLGTTSSFSFAGTDGALRIRFDATPELLALLEEDQVSSFAGMGWNIAFRDENDNIIFRWTPDGGAGGLLCDSPDANANDTCEEISDPFSINDSLGLNGSGSVAYNPGTGTFEVVTPVFDAGQTYRATIFHETSVAAILAPGQVPEPAAAGILGVGLLGLFGFRRWSKNRA